MGGGWNWNGHNATSGGSTNHKPQATSHMLLFADSPDEAARTAEIRGPCWENSRNRLAINRATTNHELHDCPVCEERRVDTRVRLYEEDVRKQGEVAEYGAISGEYLGPLRRAIPLSCATRLRCTSLSTPPAASWPPRQ